jgi:hypothetical protein
MLPFFAHAITGERRPAIFYQAHGIATGMGVDTMKAVLGHVIRIPNSIY